MKRIVREANANDVSFVMASVLNNLRRESSTTWGVRSFYFFPGHKKILEKLFERKNCRVSICCDGDDPDHIFGFLISEPPKIIHYIFTKVALRKMGVAKMLLEENGFSGKLTGCQYSHMTDTTLNLKELGKIDCDYNPYLLMEGK